MADPILIISEAGHKDFDEINLKETHDKVSAGIRKMIISGRMYPETIAEKAWYKSYVQLQNEIHKPIQNN